MHGSSRCSKSLLTFVSTFILITLVAMYWDITILLICISLVIKWVWKPLHFVHWHIFFFKMLFQAVLHFSVEFSVFFPWIWFVGIVYKFWMTVLCIYIYIQKGRAFKRSDGVEKYSPSFLMFIDAEIYTRAKY